VAGLLAGYPFDVLLGSVHWVGAWRFDDLDDPASMAEWSAREVDACWDAYTGAMEELAASRSCDVLAHPDLIKVTGHVPDAPAEWWDRLAEAAEASGMAAEVSSAGWRKPVDEQYPAAGLLDRFVARGVPLTTASDAHRLEHVAERADDLRAVLAAAGADTLQAYRGRVGRPVAVTPADTNTNSQTPKQGGAD
jgi:histidinol-phosphatase (PHP family)